SSASLPRCAPPSRRPPADHPRPPSPHPPAPRCHRGPLRGHRVLPDELAQREPALSQLAAAAALGLPRQTASLGVPTTTAKYQAFLINDIATPGDWVVVGSDYGVG